MRIAVLLLTLALAPIATSAAKPQSGQAERLPNILVILSDDVPWNTLGYQGGKAATRMHDLRRSMVLRDTECAIRVTAPLVVANRIVY